MSYAGALDLQAALYQRLAGDAALTQLVGAAIFDAPPSGPLPALHVLIGEERVADLSDATHAGGRHDVTVSVLSGSEGFAAAKQAAAAVSEALSGAPLDLAAGRLVGLRFRRATARRTGGGAGRRIDLTFRALIEA
ncbi:DUF3168 domain-containing protein [Wenxinia saemankumensis]|uniref:DUF3168 domain-containing protein n=1 Tax=Wenxinia saemankumensis TaxID=1447782 RepID=A0A1M6GMN9_9RHOB|nr:DUF3168 domain-containing protein [Wenxinia saemankumensis]SHJ11172.1 Protein of unknown function [Wenxinia saemankumensis]